MSVHTDGSLLLTCSPHTLSAMKLSRCQHPAISWHLLNVLRVIQSKLSHRRFQCTRSYSLLFFQHFSWGHSLNTKHCVHYAFNHQFYNFVEGLLFSEWIVAQGLCATVRPWMNSLQKLNRDSFFSKCAEELLRFFLHQAAFSNFQFHSPRKRQWMTRSS